MSIIRCFFVLAIIFGCGDGLRAQFAYIDTVYHTHKYNEEVSYSSLKLSDNKFIIIGYAADTAYKVNIFCINASGDTLWEKEYIDDSLSEYTLGANACFDKDKNIIIGGQYYNQVTQTQESIMAKADTNGNIEWIKVYTVPSRGSDPGVWAYGTLVTDSNQYFLMCSASTATFKDSLLIIRTDTAGSEIGRWEYGTGHQDTPWGGGIQTSDSGFLFMGSTTSEDTVNNNYSTSSIYVVKTDKNGIIQWDTSYVQIRYTGGYLVNDAACLGGIEAADGYIIFGYIPYIDNPACNSGHGQCAWDKAWVGKINKSNGDLIWEKFYGPNTLLDYGAFTSIAPTPDGNYVLCGSFVWNNSASNVACVYKIDNNGDSIWSVQFYYHDSVQIGVDPYVINTIDTSGFMVTGYVTLGSSGDAFPWVVTIDSNGYLPPYIPDTVSGISHLSQGMTTIKLYPNPTGGLLYININATNATQDFSIQIYDVSGRLLQSEERVAPNIPYPINVGSFANGMYFAEILNGSNVVGRGKFVKE